MSFNKFLLIILSFFLILNIVNAQPFEKNITINFNFSISDVIFRYIEELDIGVLAVGYNGYVVYAIYNFSKNPTLQNIFNYTQGGPTALTIFKDKNIYYLAIYSIINGGITISYYNFSSNVVRSATGTGGTSGGVLLDVGFQPYNTISSSDGMYLEALYSSASTTYFYWWLYTGGSPLGSRSLSGLTCYGLYSSSPPSLVTDVRIVFRNTDLTYSSPTKPKAVFTKTIYGDYVLLVQVDNNQTYVFFNTVSNYITRNSINKYVNYYQITPIGILFSYQNGKGEFTDYVYCYMLKNGNYYCDNVSSFFENYYLYPIDNANYKISLKRTYFQFNNYYIYSDVYILNSTAINLYVKKTPFLIIRVFDERDRISEFKQKEFYDFLGNSKGNVYQLYDLEKNSLFTREGEGIYKGAGLLKELIVYTLPDELKFNVNIKLEGINNNTKYFLRIERMYYDGFKFVRDIPIDYNFMAFTYLQYGNIYKIKVVDIDTENVIYETGPFVASQNYYVIRISNQNNIQFKTYTNQFGEKIEYYCNLQNNKVVCSFNNLNGKEVNISFVVKKTLIFNTTEMCNQNISAVSGTFECELNNEDEAYVSLFWNDYNVLLFSDTLRKQKQVFQDKFSVFISLLIVLTLSFSAIFNPFVSIVLAIIGLIITTILGLIDLSISTLVGLIVVLLLIKIKEII